MAVKTAIKPRQFYAPPTAIILGEGTDANAAIAPKIQLIRCGRFFHEQYGQLDITPAILKSFVKNFDEKTRKIDLAIDYKHNSEDIAAGWIKNIYFDENSNALYAEINWTSNGRRVLTEKEFRYVSAEFNLDYQDSESLKKYGPTLLGAGLTNRPFIKGMEPVVPLSEGELMPIMSPEDMTKAIQAMQAAIEKLTASKDAPADDAAALADKAAKDKAAKDAAAKDAPPAAPAADDKQKELADKAMKYDEMMAAKAKDAGDKAASEQKTAFDLMLSEGKAVEAQRVPFMAKDFVAFAAAAKPVKTDKISLSEKEAGVTDTTSTDPQVQIMKLAEKLVADKKSPNTMAAVSVVLADPAHKALREQYEKNSYNVGVHKPVAEGAK